MPSARTEELSARLDAYRQRLADHPADDRRREFVSAMEDFLAFVRDYDDEEAYAEFERTGRVDELRAFFSTRVLEFTWLMEHVAYDELMAKRDARATKLGPLLGENTWGAYARMEETLRLVDLTGCRRLLMVGCGPLPDSLLCLHDRTDVEALVGVDRDAHAVHMARDLVNAFGLDRIRILQGDAVDLDYGAFDVVCCSVFATPRLGIIKRVAETAGQECSIILRDPFFTGTLLFESVVRSLPPGLEVRVASEPRCGRFMLRYFVLGRGTTEPRRGT